MVHADDARGRVIPVDAQVRKAVQESPDGDLHLGPGQVDPEADVGAATEAE